MTSDRGQSETIGAILLVAITVIAVSIVAGTLFAASAPTSHPNARIDATANGSNISIEHRAGEPIHEDDFEIYLQETDTRLAGVNGVPDERMSDTDSRFEPGEIWTFDAGYEVSDGETVVLIFTSGDGVLLDETTVGLEPTSSPESTTEGTSTATATSSTEGTTTSSTTAPNTPPEASFIITSGSGNNVGLDATASDDTDGSIESYEWYEGTDTSGTSDATGQTVDKFNPAPSGQVTLVVTDDDGATDVLTKQAPDAGGGGGGRGNGGPPRP